MPKFREVSGQFVGYVPDSIDSDIVPDRAPMNGRVKFTPVFTGGVIAYPELVPPEFAHPRTIQAKIVDGFVRVEVNEGTGDDVEAVLQPLVLMVTVDDEASQVWSWRADFDEILIGASDEYVSIPAWSFRVPDGTGPVDLTELVPLKTGGSVDVTKGPRGAGLQNITAIDGQLVFEYTNGEEATIAIPEAVQGPQGEPGPAGADGEQGPEGPQGPAGEIPDLLVGNISDATPTGKNLMLAATEGAARNALGLQTGATAINGALTELDAGTSSTPRVWTASNLANYVGGQVEEAKVFVNVKDYGAKGDGVTDDIAAFNAAISAVQESGGTVHVPSTTQSYLLSETVKVTSNVRIEGSSERARIWVTSDIPVIASADTSSRVDNVHIGNLSIERYSTGRTKPLIDLTRISHSTIRDCNIRQGQEIGTTSGVHLGLDSYYNTIENVQVRGTRVGFSMKDAANGNRFTGGTLAIHCHHGYVVDGSNANAFIGASAEICSGTGFLLTNGSKMNQMVGCRVEAVDVSAYKIEWSASTPSFSNFVIAPANYLGEGVIAFDWVTDNVLIDRSMGFPLAKLKADTQRTFISAYKNSAQAALTPDTWTKVLFQAVSVDNLSEFESSAFAPKVTGQYNVTGGIAFNSGVAGIKCEVGLYINGSLSRIVGSGATTTSVPTVVPLCGQFKAAVGDTVELRCRASASTGIGSGTFTTYVDFSRQA